MSNTSFTLFMSNTSNNYNQIIIYIYKYNIYTYKIIIKKKNTQKNLQNFQYQLVGEF